MSDILLFVTLIFVFLSIPLLIFIIGAAAAFGVLYFVQFFQTGNVTDLLFADALMIVSILMYFILRKVVRWIRED